MLAGVKAVWDVRAEVAAVSGDDESVAVAEFVAISGVALVKTEAAEEVGEEVEISTTDVGDAATVASVGVEAGDFCCVAVVEAPVGLRVTCR